MLQRLPILPLPLKLRPKLNPIRLLLHQLLLHLLPRALLLLQQLLQIPPAPLLFLKLCLDVHPKLLLRVQPLLEINLHPELPVHLGFLRHLPPVLRAVFDPPMIHNLQRLSLEFEQQRLGVHLALRAITH